METDISRMGDRFDSAPIHDYDEPSQYQQQQAPLFQQQHQQQYMMQPPPIQSSLGEPKKIDFFADIDKKAWIFILVALILGFFMGKTMQPIILKTA
jgi:hypothetical protein